MKQFYHGIILTLAMTTSSAALAGDIRSNDWLQQQLNQDVKNALDAIKMAKADTQTLARQALDTDSIKQPQLARQTESTSPATERRLGE